MRNRRLLCSALLLSASALIAGAQTPNPLKPFIKEDAPVLVLEHVRVIDGTGAAPAEDQRVEIAGGKITNVQSAKLRNAYPPNAKILDLTGKTVIPGLVGMHEHLFYPLPGHVEDGEPVYGELVDTAPRLYLAGGVTTARTAGTLEPYTDLSLKKLIDAGKLPGPKLHVTGPYVGDLEGRIPQMHTLTGPDDAARLVDYWAAEGVTSFKAYMSIKPEELKAAIEHAHARHIKVTGHLCAVGFREAAALGIDNLEHGIVVDTEFTPGKQPGVCDARPASDYLANTLDIESAPVQEMIRDLVAHHVAITSTLAVFEISVANRPPLAREARVQAVMTEAAWSHYLEVRAAIAEKPDTREATLLRKEMQFERDFVKAGGLLMAGADPTSFAGVLPGYSDQRGIELLVEAGFTPVEAIHIATQNGAVFLEEDASIGTVAAGKQADLVVLNGNPAAKVEDIEKVETVFKDGIGFDPMKLTDSAHGYVGLR
jgi:imidazolonepropionase-like amidohydrolase